MRKNKALKVATGALLSALTAVILLVGGFFEILDMTSAAIASLAVLITAVEFGNRTALSVYAASSALTLILMPTASSTLYFVLLVGYFPVLKRYCDKKLKKKAAAFVPKFILFNFGCTAIIFVFIKLYGFEAFMSEMEFGVSPKALLFVLFFILNIFLVVYDLMMDNVTVIYERVLRKRIFPKR